MSNDELRAAAQAVVDRWDTPSWKDAPATAEYIGRLRVALASQPAAQGWTALPGELPEPGYPVLLDIGKEFSIRAMWAAKHTVQSAEDDSDWGEYVEERDIYYAPEGWYEWNQHEEIHWRVDGEPRAWMPLPHPFAADGGEAHGPE